MTTSTSASSGPRVSRQSPQPEPAGAAAGSSAAVEQPADPLGRHRPAVRRVPSAWAKWLTRSSSSSHGTSRSGPATAPPAAARQPRAGRRPRARGPRACGRGRRPALSGSRSSRRAARAQVALDVGQARGAGRRRRTRRYTSRPSWRATSRARRVAAARPRSASSARAHVARGVEDRARRCATIAAVRLGQRRRRRGRAAARSRPRPTPGRRPRAIERVDRRASSRPRARRRRCRAARRPARAARGVAEPVLAPSAAGDGIVEQRAAGACRRASPRACAPRRLEHAHADASRPRRPAPGRRATACAGAGQRDRRAAASPIVHARQPGALELRRRGGQLGAQPRAHLLAQRVEVLARGERRSPSSSSTAEASSAGAAGSRGEVPGVRRDAHAALRLELARPAPSSSGPRRGSQARRAPRAATSGHRHERAAQLLGQRAQQRGDELARAAPARATRSPSARSCGSACSGTWTVTPSCAAPGLEAVGQLQRRARPGARRRAARASPSAAAAVDRAARA